MYHTDAVILKLGEWSEADWLVTAFTRDFGKIRLLAQGARKHGAKLQGHLEPGAITALSFVIGRNGYRLTSAHLQESFSETRRSLSKSRTSAGILRLLDQNLFEERDRSGELFETACRTFFAIAEAKRLATLQRLGAWFYVRFFAFLGLLPAVDSPEARDAQTIFLIGSVALGDLERFPVREETLATELVWLSRELARAGSDPRAVEATAFALY